MRTAILLAVSIAFTASAVLAQESRLDTSRGDRMIAEYFRIETEKLQSQPVQNIRTIDQWKKKRVEYRRQLLEMLGLDPLPEKTDLQATVTGTTEHDEFRVERLHFQSRPGLYVTGNLYLPKKIDKPLPAILYVCGHGRVKKNGVSYGNKVHYHHHGSWFARNGYVCLTIDTLQLGEIEGIHHGTYREGMWWWLNRGYTPAGVEAWNCVRALDYLESRKEVDASRIGVTGRSGGGAYSWWIAAIDERIKCAVPVAGITDLQNHVVDGCVEGHCDCMFMVNTYRWDYSMVAALVAPRPLLISNTDTDRIFPLDGVYRTYTDVRHIYRLYGEADKVALNITAGGHKDTQELRVHAFRWLNHHLRDDDNLLTQPAVKFFEPENLQVFAKLPEDQINTNIHETFVPAANVPLPKDAGEWKEMRKGWLEVLRQKSFAGWPREKNPPDVEEVFSAESEGIRLAAYDFASQDGIELRLYVAQRVGLKKPELVVLNVLNEIGWRDFLATMRPAFEDQLQGEALPQADDKSFQQTKKMFENFNWAMAYVAPRGVGPTAWDQSERKQIQHQRRFYLLGQTLEGMQVWDVRRAIQTLRSAGGMPDVPLWLQAEGRMAGVTLYASLFENDVTRLDLHNLPKSHRDGPYLLNVRRQLDVPQSVTMAAERSKVVLYQQGDEGWEYPQTVARKLGWKNALQIRQAVK